MRHTRVAHFTLFIFSIAVVWGEPARAQQVERGPYLQQATSNSVTVRWRTDIATDAVVRFGTDVTLLDRAEVGSPSDTEHEVVVTGLTPGTLYYYSVGDSAGALAGGDASFTFRASPATGTQQNTRVWVIGDSGTADSNARRVRDAYLSYSASRPADLWLMLGDNAYNDGTDAEYQSAVFDTYPTILRNTPLWTTLGNHDGHSATSSTEQGPYYDIFTLPRNAEAGGIASGTEAYYSFDYGNIHFITLDSYDTDSSVGGAMLTWLENDLASTTQEWLIAYWHHPPYTKGSHNSDTEGKLVDMRERALPILESYGVDLVLSGHSHSYERSFLIDGHYGTSSTFSSSMLIDGGSGRADGAGTYAKMAGGNPNQGAVYAVAGSSGKTSGGSLNHPVMFLSLQRLGSMIIDVNGDRLDAEFIDDAGVRLDYFTMQKGAGGGDTEQPTPVSDLAASSITSTSVTLGWNAASDNVAVTGYRVSRNGSVVSTTSTLSYVDSGLVPTTAYSYSVVAFDAAGNESTMTSISVTTSAAADVDAPTPISNLAASSITSTSVTLGWNAASDNVAVTGYRVSRNGSVVSTTSTLSYVDTGLVPTTAYSYSVVAFDAAGNESTMTSISVTTSAAADVDAPTPISNLAASSITSTSVTLGWNAASDNVAVTGYRVSRNGSVVSTTSTLSYVDTGLVPTTAYSYSVVAFDAAGNESTPTSVAATTQSTSTDGNNRDSGGGSIGVVGVMMLMVFVVLLRGRDPRFAIRAVSFVLLLGTPLLATSHEDLDLQIADVKQKIESAPDDYRLHVKLGELHGMHADWPLAVISLMHAQSLASDTAATDLDLKIGESLYRAGSPNKALPFVGRFLDAHTDSSDGWRIQANILGSLNETNAALASFDRSIRIARVPTPELYYERARFLEGRPNRIDELLAGIDDGIARLGPLSSLLEYAINIELQRENYSAAVARMDALPDSMRQQPRWLFRRSTTLLKLGHAAEAKQVNRTALNAIDDLPAGRRNTQAYAALRSEIDNSYAAMTAHSGDSLLISCLIPLVNKTIK